MKTYKVTLQPKAGGMTIQTTVTVAAPPSTARTIAENQNPGYRAVTAIEQK